MLHNQLQALRFEFFSRKPPNIHVIAKQAESISIAEHHLLPHLTPPAAGVPLCPLDSLRLLISVVRRFLRALQPLEPNFRHRCRTVDELATNLALLSPLLHTFSPDNFNLQLVNDMQRVSGPE